jgi:hypothetical protein
MKKLLPAIAILVLALGASATTITVTQPKESTQSKNCKDFWDAIEWTKSGALPATVKITLRDAVSLAEVAVIAQSAPNSGSYYTWCIPATTPDGKYRVRVKAVGVDVYGDSEAFTIKLCPALEIKDPMAGASWRGGDTHLITWVSNNMTLLPTISLFLQNAMGQQVLTIAASISNKYQYSWKVPENLPVGKYQILLKSATTADQALSGLFTLLPAFPHGVLTPVKKK